MTSPNGRRPRPVLVAAGAVGTAVAGVSALVQFAAQNGLLDDVTGPLGAVIAFLLPLGAALGVWGVSEGRVTPLSDPVSSTGQALVEARSVEDVVRAVAPVALDYLTPRAGSQKAVDGLVVPAPYPTPVEDGTAATGRHALDDV